MGSFHVIAMPQDIADAVRSTGTSPFAAHPTQVEVAKGYGPCRLCLRTFTVGEERRILFTYDPFAGIEPLPLPGPVFIHETACERYAETAGFPDNIRLHALTFNAYGRGRRLLAQTYVRDGNVEAVIDRLLTRADVEYIHVRDTEAGCYDCRLERSVKPTC